MVKVLVIEDADIGRMGRTAALEVGGHDVTAMRWEDATAALGAPVDIGAHTVVVAALRPDDSSWDRYPVLPTVQAVASQMGPGATTLGLLWGAANDNPLLHLRLANAGLGRIADGASVRTIDDMHDLVTGSVRTRPARPADADLLMAGVSPGADVDGVVEWVLDRLAGADGAAYANAFDPQYTQNACGLSRRQAHTLRVRLTALGRIRPNPLHAGGGPVRDRSLPRWNEVVAVANLCRGVDPKGRGPSSEDWAHLAPWRAA